eukprot:TRINITY_DN2222_c0_g1_i6.p1 TRINITY_DN2222_c0_g1~~TRINITY_DN2222_c0_g1_i6.p1  ORF type:complete len:218 (-),score=62.20 TRINITY_DN2222_c0_g1_i6:115-768(-)
MMERLSLFHIRDSLNPSLETTQDILSLLFPLLEYADKNLFKFVEASGVQPYFALSWILTWFSHGFDDLNDIARLFDLFIATHPLMPLYVSVQIIIHFREELLNNVECEYSAVHSFLSKIPQNLPFEDIIRKSVRLFNRFPPEKLQEKAHHLKETCAANRYPFDWMPVSPKSNLIAEYANHWWKLSTSGDNLEKVLFFVVLGSFVATGAYIFYEARTN